jgi:PTS system mannose-specific IIA component
LLGIVLVAHGELPQTFLSVAEKMLGKQQYIECVSYDIGDDLETLRYKIASSIKNADNGSGVIVLTDMFGGVPSNIAISVGYSQKTEVISGMNLSMLLKLITIRTSIDLKTAITQTKEIGIKYIYVLSELLTES